MPGDVDKDGFTASDAPMRSLHRCCFALGASCLSVALLAALGSGCEATGESSEFEATSGPTQSTTSGSGGSSGALTGTGGSSGTLAGAGGSTQGVGGGCAGLSSTAQKAPLDLYIMFDQSGSMEDPPAGGGGTKWSAVASALTTFVQQPQSSGIGVGIQYFPLSSGASCNVLQCASDADCGAGCGPCEMPVPGFGVCTGFGATDSCTVSDYATPDVEIAVLPGNAAAISTSVASHSPSGGTPTSAALEGAVSHASAWAAANPGHVVVVVLATDGDPSSCNTDPAYINGVAATGASGTPPILTFVIGVGGSTSALDGIAAAGGTGQAFMIDQDPDVQQAFIAALEAIQGQALPCAYLIPEPEPGETLDFGKVNVSYTPDGGMAEQLPKVVSEADCPPGELAWYYDDNAAPTQILLCPDTCAALSQDTAGTVEIVLGCETIVR
jgi:hypothetical protein